jgi:two-component system, cell cycle response regulator DivK
MPSGAPNIGRVLVVDDDEHVRAIFVRHLTSAGFDAIAVPGAPEGLRVLREEGNIGLVLLDLAMPGMNGLEFRTQQLADHSIADVPVVVVSGSPIGTEDQKRLRAKDYVSKPVGRDELLLVVSRHCRRLSK